jgi:acyl-CoA dehydrogenase
MIVSNRDAKSLCDTLCHTLGGSRCPAISRAIRPFLPLRRDRPDRPSRLPCQATSMDIAPSSFDALHAAVRQIAREVAQPHAHAVDRDARFPQETIDALRRAQVLSAPVPRDWGGAQCNMRELGLLVSTLAMHCGASAMVLAMHYIQVACLVRHAQDDAYFQGVLKELCEQQLLLASMTSEVGTWGDTRASICALKQQDARFDLNKQATTGSYCEQADAILVTTRRHDDAASGDQLLVLVRRGDYQLRPTSTWDTLGMRGTCSPGYELTSSASLRQVLPDGYPDIFAQTMVPYSHILWSALWHGLAAGAQAQAASHVRDMARKTPGSTPPSALPLAELGAQLQALHYHWQGLADSFDQHVSQGSDSVAFARMGWSLQMNQLKVACSEAAPRLIHQALQIVGLPAYKNDGPFSIGRAYRDALSASLMISNLRINTRSAALLLVHKAEDSPPRSRPLNDD